MHGKKGVLKGKKISCRHQTYIEIAGKVISILKSHEGVKKIVLGRISLASGSASRIDIKSAGSNVKLLCRSGNAVQILFVIGVDETFVRNALRFARLIS